jgi:hypothetical protein
MQPAKEAFDQFILPLFRRIFVWLKRSLLNARRDEVEPTMCGSEFKEQGVDVRNPFRIHQPSLWTGYPKCRN